MLKLLSKGKYNELKVKEDKLTSLETIYNDLIRYYDNVPFSNYRSRYTSIQLNNYIKENEESKKLIEDLEGELNTLEQHEVNWLMLMRYLSLYKKESEYIKIDDLMDYIIELEKESL